jgi:hypothetical protein
MVKDFFNEVIRRMEWAKGRRLTPEVKWTQAGIVCRIPLDDDVSYTVSIKETKDPGVLIQSLFPDGEPHHYFKVPQLSLEQTVCLIDAAALIVYGAPMAPPEASSGRR